MRQPTNPLSIFHVGEGVENNTQIEVKDADIAAGQYRSGYRGLEARFGTAVRTEPWVQVGFIQEPELQYSRKTPHPADSKIRVANYSSR